MHTEAENQCVTTNKFKKYKIFENKMAVTRLLCELYTSLFQRVTLKLMSDLTIM